MAISPRIDFNTDKAAVALLRETGWTHPPQGEIPTGGELVARYLEPLAALPVLRGRVRSSCSSASRASRS